MRKRKLPPQLATGLLSIAIISATLYVGRTLNSHNEQQIAESKKDAWAKMLKEHPYNHEVVNNVKEGPKRPDRPDLAAHQDALMTMDPSIGAVPVERLLAAHATVNQRLQMRAPIPGVSWEERGPNNVGGRTRGLLFDPNDPTNKKVWAGGVFGGLWYTNDITVSAPTWVHVDDMWDNMAITTIAVDPSNTNVFYVGTGEGLGGTDKANGGGIWKSTDAGSTWNHLASTAPGAYNSASHFHKINKIVVKANGHVFASTHGYFTNTGGVVRSTSGGVNWSLELDAAAVGGPFNWSPDIELASNGDLYAAVSGEGSAAQVFKSTNANNGTFGTWTDLSSAIGMAGAKRIELASAPSNSSIIYAVAQGGSGSNDTEWFKKSTDGGSTWSSISIPRLVDDGVTHFTRKQAWYDLIIAVHPSNPSFVITGAIDQHRSLDGGNTWTSMSHWYGGFGKPEVHADQHAIVFRPGASNEVIFGNDGGIYYSADAGNSAATPTFASRNSGYNVTQYYACATKNEVNSNYFLGGAQDNGSHRFTLPQMNSIDHVTGGDGAYCHIDQLDPNIQMTAYTQNVIYRSLDGGASFPEIISEGSSGHFINPSDYDSQLKIFYSAANDDQVKRVTGMDGTINNQDLSISIGGAKVSHVKVSPHSDVVFLGVENGRVYKMSNASTATPTVTRVDNGTTPITSAGWVACIDVGANDNELMVIYSNYGVTSVWETTNGGTAWNSKEGNLPDMPIRWAIYNPNNREQVLLGTELGAWSTDAFGHGTASAPTWDPTNTNLAHTRVDMLKYRAADGMVIAATHGRGLYTTDVFVTSTVADFAYSPKFSCTSSLTVNFTDGSLKPGGSWAWDIDNNGSVDYTTRNATHTYPSPGVYSVKLTVNSGGATITKESSIVVMGAPPVAYTECTLAGNSNNGNNFEFGIYRVALNEIGHSTSHNDGEYHDYTCTQMTTLQVGTNYDVSVTTSSLNFEAAKVYIDYNNSGMFDAGEEVASFPAAIAGTRTASFTTPSSGVTMDTALRMRVVSRNNNSPTNGCSTDTHGQVEDYTVYFNSPPAAEITVAAKVFLEGPFNGTDMDDGLRTGAHIPSIEPYSAIFTHVGDGGGETVAPAVLAVTGSNAIVDWVYIELRDKTDHSSIVNTRSALIQRDGDIVDTDGTSPVSFTSSSADNYFVAIRHRNHLATMSLNTVSMSPAGSIDFTTTNSNSYGTLAKKDLGGGVFGLWMGNTDANSEVKYTGPDNDRDPILVRIGGSVPTNVVTGYFGEDCNLNGEVKYTGPENDRDPILVNIGGSIPTLVKVEQLP